MTDNEIVEKVTENLKRSKCLEPLEARDIIDQKDAKIADLTKENLYLRAEDEKLQIELKAMRGAANSYKAEVERLQTENEQLKSDIICANQNFDHIKQLWEKEKEKVENAKLKVIEAYKKLQTAKTEAIKEFAKRLKKRIGDLHFQNYGLVILEIIDLVTEMTKGGAKMDGGVTSE